jgi:hypothetical protein
MSHAGDTITVTNADVSAATATARRRRILVVEDQSAIRELLRLHLSLAAAPSRWSARGPIGSI